MRIKAESKGERKASQLLWDGLIRHNRKAGGPLRYSRKVLTARSDSGRILGGVILQSYWKETYVEVLWLSPRARGKGYARQLMAEAERRARRHGSVFIHLNTFSFQAPGLYEKLGFKRFGGLSGSPAGESRHWYVKHLGK